MDYFEHYQRVNDLSESGRRTHWKPFDKTVGKFLPDDREARIIDVGCGAGILLEWLNARGYLRAEGVDRDGGQVDFCHSLGVTAEQVSDTAAWLRQQRGVDLIIFKDILEHIPESDVGEVLEAATHALAAGGRVYVAVPNAAASFATYWRYIDNTHLRSYTQNVLALTLNRAGLCVVYTGDDDTMAFSSALGVGRLLLRTVFRFIRRLEAIAEFGGDGVRMPLGLNLVMVAERHAE